MMDYRLQITERVAQQVQLWDSTCFTALVGAPGADTFWRVTVGCSS